MIIIAEVSELTRKIKLPTDRVLSVNGDYQVDGIAFKLPATYEGDFDFSTAAARVHWTGVDKVEHTNLITEVDGNGYPLWVMPSELTQGGHGVIEFAISFVATDATAAVTKRWISDPVSFRNRRTVSGSNEDEEAEEEKIYERLASAIAAVRAAQASVDDVAEVLSSLGTLTFHFVDAKADMTDQTKLYVLTTDGYLYYYSTAASDFVPAFEVGGSQEVIDARTDENGTTYANLKTRINTGFTQLKEDLSSIQAATLRKTDIRWFVGKSVNSSGTIQSNTSAALSNVIPVSEGTRIKRVGASKDSSNRDLFMYVNAYENMVFKSRTTLNKDGVYTVPDDVDAVCFGFARSGSHGVAMTSEDIESYFGVEWHFATESSVDAEQTRNSGDYLDNLLEKFCVFGSGSSNGIDYDLIDSEAHSYYAHGSTSDTISFFNMYNGLVPGCLERGKTYFILYENTAEARNCYARFIFYDKDGNVTQPEAFGHPYAVTIPDNAFTVIFRFYVAKNQTVDTTIKFLKLVEVQEQKMSVPYIISFVDDDASSTTYVERYYNSCKRNGINGNYAVITNKFESGATDPDMLLNYEDDGMGMLIHCSEQSYSVAPEWMDRDYDECRKNLYKGMRAMQERGFVNYRYWVMPYGYVNDDFKQLAVDAGMECMISSANFTYNNMAHFDRYHIKRYSLNPADTEDSKGNLAAIKTAIDEMQNLPSCWMIITTHFNEWGSVTWDSTVDETGFPVGYERMNEIIQYAKASGAAVLTVPEAWRYYEPILEANEQRYNKVRP